MKTTYLSIFLLACISCTNITNETYDDNHIGLGEIEIKYQDIFIEIDKDNYGFEDSIRVIIDNSSPYKIEFNRCTADVIFVYGPELNEERIHTFSCAAYMPIKISPKSSFERTISVSHLLSLLKENSIDINSSTFKLGFPLYKGELSDGTFKPIGGFLTPKFTLGRPPID